MGIDVQKYGGHVLYIVWKPQEGTFQKSQLVLGSKLQMVDIIVVLIFHKILRY